MEAVTSSIPRNLPVIAFGREFVVVLMIMNTESERKERSEIVFHFIESLVEKLVDSVGENLISVVLYGSYARGCQEPDSDVDLLIVARGLSPSSLERQAFFTKILHKVETLLAQSITRECFPYISAILKTPQEADCTSRIYFDMIEEARIFFDKGDFFRSVLKKVKERLKILGARKIQRMKPSRMRIMPMLFERPKNALNYA